MEPCWLVTVSPVARGPVSVLTTGGWEQVVGSRLWLVLGVGSVPAPLLDRAQVELGGCSEIPREHHRGVLPAPQACGAHTGSWGTETIDECVPNVGLCSPLLPGSATGVLPTAAVSAEGRQRWCQGDRRDGSRKGWTVASIGGDPAGEGAVGEGIS